MIPIGSVSRSEPRVASPMTPIRMAQYGTRHGHADGKLAAMKGCTSSCTSVPPPVPMFMISA